MADTTTAVPQNQFTPQDSALRNAWRRVIQHSITADKLKRNSTRFRYIIILLSLIATCLGILSAIQPTPEMAPFFNSLFSSSLFQSLVRGLLVIVPLVTASIMVYINQFMPSTSWIAHRIGSELIRLNIYLYRTNAGEYVNEVGYQQQQLLTKRMGEARKQILDMGSTEPEVKLFNHKKVDNEPENKIDLESQEYYVGLIPQFVDDPELDDGFSRMSVMDYINMRLIPQTGWYREKLTHDYDQVKRWRIVTLSVGVLGSIFALAGAGPVVTITTAFSVAAGLYVDLRMYGRTYSIYNSAMTQLENEREVWDALPPEVQADPEQIADFIRRCEAIFQEERERWMEQVTQSQLASEQRLRSEVPNLPTAYPAQQDTDEDDNRPRLNDVSSFIESDAQSAPPPTLDDTPNTPGQSSSSRRDSPPTPPQLPPEDLIPLD